MGPHRTASEYSIYPACNCVCDNETPVYTAILENTASSKNAKLARKFTLTLVKRHKFLTTLCTVIVKERKNI